MFQGGEDGDGDPRGIVGGGSGDLSSYGGVFSHPTPDLGFSLAVTSGLLVGFSVYCAASDLYNNFKQQSGNLP